MPLHNFACNKCEEIYEVFVSLDENDNTINCPECGEALKKIIAAPYFVVH